MFNANPPWMMLCNSEQHYDIDNANNGFHGTEFGSKALLCYVYSTQYICISQSNGIIKRKIMMLHSYIIYLQTCLSCCMLPIKVYDVITKYLLNKKNDNVHLFFWQGDKGLHDSVWWFCQCKFWSNRCLGSVCVLTVRHDTHLFKQGCAFINEPIRMCAYICSHPFF